jgi:hypothetical protein
MSDPDDLEANEKQAAHLVGRTIVEATVSGVDGKKAFGLWLMLDDGSRVIIEGLRNGGVEVAWLSPGESFELAREVMEEEIADGGS